MFDVGDDQFLVLLFMMEAKRNDGRELCQLPLIEPLQQLNDTLIDIPAVGIRLLDGGPGDQPTFGPAMPFSKRIVIRVEEVRVLWMQRPVIRNCRKEQEGLEKPADVGEMPLGRADIWHGLNDIIFGDQGFAQVLRKAANVLVLLNERRIGCCLTAERTCLDGFCQGRFSFCWPVRLHSIVSTLPQTTLTGLVHFTIGRCPGILQRLHCKTSILRHENEA